MQLSPCEKSDIIIPNIKATAVSMEVSPGGKGGLSGQPWSMT